MVSRLFSIAAIFVWLSAGSPLHAFARVNVILWFDTEDFINPESDDAALRIANELSRLGVPATFKVVGEKARVLESRHRTDVIAALRRHAIGYHSNFHSLQPVPALYLKQYGYTDGADEFERREKDGARDVARIFGTPPLCYGQPGSSWAPQADPALRRMGIPVYLDEGTQIGLNDQPFWYSGMLYVFNMGQYLLRPDLNDETKNPAIYQQTKAAAVRLAGQGGGTISIYFHPNEYVEKAFWDAVNFSHGATPEPSAWKPPPMRSAADSERCYKVLTDYVKFVSALPDVHWITAADLPHIYTPEQAPALSPTDAAKHLRQGITFLRTPSGDLSAGELLLTMLGLPAGEAVDGPATRGATTLSSETIPAWLFEKAKADFAAFVHAHHRLPAEVYVGSDTLSLADFAATTAEALLSPGPIHPAKGRLDCEQYVSRDPVGSFSWPIHPSGFSAPELLELARLQAWTLKPARLR